jgi:hypothetical protein
MGGGNSVGELMDLLDGSMTQSSTGNSTSEMGQIAGDALSAVAAFV